jgi:hypothetical protein
MRQLTDNRLIAIALVGIVLVAVLTFLLTPPPPAPSMSVRSIAPDGAMALSLWFEQSGYHVQQVLSSPIKFGQIDTLFVLDPIFPYPDADIVRIRDWVEEGHTLVVAGQSVYALNDLLDAFDVSLRYISIDKTVLSPPLPTLNSPPVNAVEVGAAYAIVSDRDDLVTHLSRDDDALLVSFRQGEGTVWVSGMMQPFTNQGLSDEQNARLILNFVANLSENAVIGFDEARHGFQEGAASLTGWLVGSPAGWGILTTLVLTLIFLGLHGRRFGRIVPIPQERLQREPVEYIQAIANLFRRSGQREVMLRHYGGQLRRRLSERYSLDPRLSDDELVKSVAFRDTDIDPAALRNVFRQLSRNKLSEDELLRTAIDVDDWLRKIS